MLSLIERRLRAARAVRVLTAALLLGLAPLMGAAPLYGQSAQEEGEERSGVLHPMDVPGLLTFWDFQEPTGTTRVSTGRYAYALEEMNGPVERDTGGVFGPYSADVEWGQWFRIKREDAPGLNLHGDDQEVTIVAWIKRGSDRNWQFIAGMWNEGTEAFKGRPSGTGAGAPARQYGLFISGTSQSDHTTYERTPAEHQVMGYASPYGGATPGRPFAFDYATGATRLEQNRWYMIGYTFNGEALKVYVDGALDANGNHNPFLYDGPIHDGGEDGSDFTVAQRMAPRWTTYPEGEPPRNTGFSGPLGGLAVYDRALTAEEMARLYQGTLQRDASQRDANKPR